MPKDSKPLIAGYATAVTLQTFIIQSAKKCPTRNLTLVKSGKGNKNPYLIAFFPIEKVSRGKIEKHLDKK